MGNIPETSDWPPVLRKSKNRRQLRKISEKEFLEMPLVFFQDSLFQILFGAFFHLKMLFFAGCRMGKLVYNREIAGAFVS